MITELSPELKTHIELYIDDIENSNITNSIIHCPINVLEDYIKILKHIDMEPKKALKSYIDVALCLASKTVGSAYCSKIDSQFDNIMYEFEIHPQNLDWRDFQTAVMQACPYHFVQSNIKYEYGSPRTVIQVILQPLDKVRF